MSNKLIITDCKHCRLSSEYDNGFFNTEKHHIHVCKHLKVRRSYKEENGKLIEVLPVEAEYYSSTPIVGYNDKAPIPDWCPRLEEQNEMS